MSKRKLLIFIPPVIILATWLLLKKAPFSVIGSRSVEMSAFTDQGIDGGNSRIVDIESNPEYKAITFELKKGFISPYAGISFFENSYWDLSNFSDIELELELENTKNLELAIATYQDGVTKEDEPLSFRHNVIEIPVTDRKTICSLPLKRMHIAQWWLERFKLRSTELGEANWKKAKSLSFVAKIRLDQNKLQKIKISKITFVKDLNWFYIGAFIFVVAWYSGIFIYFKTSASKATSNIVVQYRKTEEARSGGNENNELLAYITENYTDPDLTLQKLSEKMRISEKTISTFIQKRFNVTFKEFLNGIRLTEAKRLLVESDKNVSEIAFQVGFNSPNHFNRIFKNQARCTPTEYRSAQKATFD